VSQTAGSVTGLRDCGTWAVVQREFLRRHRVTGRGLSSALDWQFGAGRCDGSVSETCRASQVWAAYEVIAEVREDVADGMGDTRAVGRRHRSHQTAEFKDDAVRFELQQNRVGKSHASALVIASHRSCR